MADAKPFFDQVYDLDTVEKTLEFYRQRAHTYDDELRKNGYASPARTAAAMATNVADLTAPLLDLGCGTGLSGEALQAAGFKVIDGSDFSPEMLSVATAKNLYRATFDSDETNPIPAKTGDYQNYAAIGVFSPGHAPPQLIPAVVDMLPSQGCFGFTLNDHALEDSGYEDCVMALANAGTVDVAFKEYGDHIPPIGLQSMVCVLRKQ